MRRPALDRIPDRVATTRPGIRSRPRAADAQVTHTESDGDVMRDLRDWSVEARRAPWQPVDMIAPDELVPRPEVVVPRERTPRTIEEWQAVADRLLSNRCCAFHRNAAISSRYAWIYGVQPACFKWTAMAAIASHHVRLALYPPVPYRSRWIPGPPTNRGSSEAADSRRAHDQVHQQRHLQRHLLGASRIRQRRGRDGASACAPAPERHYAPMLRLRSDRSRTPGPRRHDGVDGRSSDGG